MATPIPGCADCPSRTSHGGRSKQLVNPNPLRYQVVDKAGDVIGQPFRSATAAATFMAGHPGSQLKDLGKTQPPPERPFAALRAPQARIRADSAVASCATLAG